MDSIYTKIARFSAIYRLFIESSGNYLHLGVVVHYKTVSNNNILSVNYRFNSNYSINGTLLRQ